MLTCIVRHNDIRHMLITAAQQCNRLLIIYIPNIQGGVISTIRSCVHKYYINHFKLTSTDTVGNNCSFPCGWCSISWLSWAQKSPQESDLTYLYESDLTYLYIGVRSHLSIGVRSHLSMHTSMTTCSRGTVWPDTNTLTNGNRRIYCRHLQ